MALRIDGGTPPPPSYNFNGSVTLTVTPAASMQFDGGVITPQAVTTLTVTDESGGAQTNVPVTFGHSFKQGDVPSGATLIAKIGGVPITTQSLIKSAHADGSARHAILSCVVPSLTALGSQTLTLETTGTPGGGVPITKADVLATAFDSAVTCTIGGTVYSLTARSLLDGSVPVVLDLAWMSGPQCSEFVVGGRLRNGGATHAHLCAYFHVRAYGASGNVTRVRCDVIVENGWTFVAGAGAITYNITATVGGATVYSNAAYVHYHHSRWHARGWWGVDPQVRWTHNTAYLKASKAVPNYGTGTVSAATLNSYTAYSPGGNANLRANWGDTGYHEQIGHLPEWDAAYVKTGDVRAFNATVANTKAAGSYSYHYRDENTGYPPLLDSYPELCESEGTGGIVIGTGGAGYSHEPGQDPNAHQPLVGYLAYLLTGDYCHLEELQFLANYNMVWTSRGSRAAGTGNNAYGVTGLQHRGRAWGMRTVAHAAAITPDAHPLKSYLVAKTNNHISHYTSTYATVGGSNYNILGAIQDYDWANGNPPKYSPWQADFMTGVMCRLVELGFSASTLQTWSARWPTGRMGQPGIGNGYCKFWASDYQFTSGIVDSGGAYNASFAQLYVENWNLACTPPGPNATTGWMQSAAFPEIVTGYYSNMRPALAMAVDAGVANARTWRDYEAMGSVDYSNDPVWDIVPRFGVPAALAALAPGEWYEFPSSAANAVDPCPGGGCSYQGSNGFEDVMLGWSGGAYDSKRDRLIAWGGGHGGYYGNLMIAFDVNLGQWLRLTDPSPIVSGDLAPPNATAYYADGQPSARHTYNSLQYVVETDAFMSLLTPGTSGGSGVFGPWADRFTLSNNTWASAGTIPNVPEQSGENEIGAFSAVDGFGNCWVHTTTNGNNRLYKYTPSTNTWTAHATFVRGYYPGQGCTAAIDTKRHRMVTVGADSNGHMFYRWDLNNPNAAPVALTGFPSALNADIAPGFDYDPVGDRFLAWNGGQTVHVLNAATLVWSALSVSGAVPPTANARGTYGRFRYAPAFHGFILANRTDQNVFFLKT